MSRWRKFRKFKELGWAEGGYLFFAAAALITVGVLLGFAGLRRSLAWLRRSSGAAGSREGTVEALAWARRKAYLIAVAARFGPYRATCLRRSLLLWWVTRRHGLDPRLCIGVRRESGTARAPDAGSGKSELLAHAWVELAGEVLNDRPEIAQSYAAFDAESLPAQVSWS